MFADDNAYVQSQLELTNDHRTAEEADPHKFAQDMKWKADVEVEGLRASECLRVLALP